MSAVSGAWYPGPTGFVQAPRNPSRIATSRASRARAISAIPCPPASATVRLSLIGIYAHANTLGPGVVMSRLRGFWDYLPHQSGQMGAWDVRSPWFAAKMPPVLRAEVARAKLENLII